MRRARRRPARSGVLSPFQAFMTALGASIGTGNIAGVADGDHLRRSRRAVLDLGLRLRRDRDQVRGGRPRRPVPPDRTATTVLSGPMYYLRDGLKSPALAWIYALVAGVAALTTTPFTQPNSIAVAREHASVRRARSWSRVGDHGWSSPC